MKILILAALAVASLFAQSKEKEKEATPVVSEALEKEYWKELSVYNGINADLQESARKVALDEQMLDQQRKRVNDARDAVAAACGAKFELDTSQLKKGVFACIPKKLPEKKPAGN